MVENWSKVMGENRPTIYNDNQYLIEEYKKIQQWLKEEKANFLLVKEKNNSVSFKIPVTVNGKQEYVKRTTGEKITLDGLARLKVKCRKLKEYLGSNPSLSQIISFIDGLNKEKQEIVDDRITIEEAVKKVEKWFFQRKDRRKLQRSKNEGSDRDCWYREYEYYYNKIPKGAIVTYDTLKEALDSYGIDPETGETNPYLRKYQDCLRAYIRLCEINKLKPIQEKLEELKISKDQWKASRKYTQDYITSEEFYKLREAILTQGSERYKKDREFWAWIYSVQFVYGLRISEVLHIRNWTEDYCPAKDPEENNPLNYVFPALIDVKKNPEHIIYIGNYREPTPNDKRRKNAKTGWRYAHPIEDPEYPNMFQDFGIIEGIQKHLSRLKTHKRSCLVMQANKNLKKWSKKYLGREIHGTHTFRRAASHIKYSTVEDKRIYENEMGHSSKVAEESYIERSPEADKELVKRKRMTEANQGKLKTDIATAKKIITQMYKKLPSEARIIARNVIIFIFKLLFELDFDPDKED